MLNTIIDMMDETLLNISLYGVIFLITIKDYYTSPLKLRHILYFLTSIIAIVHDIMLMTIYIYDGCLVSNILGMILLVTIYILKNERGI